MTLAALVLVFSVPSLAAGSGVIVAVNPSHASWKEAREALDRKDWLAAAEHFRAYRVLHLSDPAGWIMEAWTRTQSGEQEQADALFGGVLELDPAQPDALLHLAEKAWLNKDLAKALRLLGAVRDVPPHLQDGYHHLLGVVLVMLDREPRRAIQHLGRTRRADNPTRVLLALAHLRDSDEAGARPILEQLCPPRAGQSLRHTWLGCLDADYCGELLDHRLEILRRLVTSPSQSGTDADVADAVRVFIRHRRPAGGLVERLRDASRRRPEACRLYMLAALVQDIPVGTATSEACALFTRAQACPDTGGDSEWPPLSGPLLEPGTGAALDLTMFRYTASRLISHRCRSRGTR